MRCLNLQAVLNALRDGHPAASPQLCELLDVHPSTVIRLMSSLTSAGLVREVDPPDTASVGRPPKIWQLSSDAGHVVGLALQPMMVRGTLVDLSGRSLAKRVIAYDPPLTTRTLPTAVAEIVGSLTAAVPSADVMGIGVGVSGVVDPRDGTLLHSGGFFDERGRFADYYPLPLELQRLFPCPVKVANDANVGALAVFHHMVRGGEIAADGTLLYLMSGESLWGSGSGLIINGRLHTGAHGSAGETIHPSITVPKPDWGDLPDRALAGEHEAIAEVLSYLRAEHEHFAALTLFIDAHHVILGGALPTLGEQLLSTLAEMITSTAGFGDYLSDVPRHVLVFDPLRPDTIPLGAAELVLEELFCDPVVGHIGPLVHRALAVGLQ